MTSKEIILQLLSTLKVSMAALGKEINKSRQNVLLTLKSEQTKSMNVKTFSDMLNALGYKLVVVPKLQSVKDGIEVEE